MSWVALAGLSGQGHVVLCACVRALACENFKNKLMETAWAKKKHLLSQWQTGRIRE